MALSFLTAHTAQAQFPFPVPAPPPAAAQEQSAPAPQAAEPSSTPLSDLAEVLERSAVVVRRTTQDRQPRRIEEIEGALTRLAATVAALHETQTPGEAETQSSTFGDLERRVWRRVSTQLDALQQDSHALAAELERDLTDLSAQSAALRAARVELEQRGGQEDTLATIDRMLSQTTRVEESARRRQLVVIGLQARVAELSVDTAQSVEDLARVPASSPEASLFRLEAPPLWTAVAQRNTARRPEPSAGATAPPPVADTPRVATTSETAGQLLVLRQVAAILLTSVAEQLALWVLFALPLFLLRRRESRWRQVANPAVTALISVARRPISAALLPAFMVAAIWRGRITLDSLLLLLPLLRIVPQLVPPGFKPLLWGIAGAYVGNMVITQNFSRVLLPGRLLTMLLIAAMAFLVQRLARAVSTANSEALQQIPASIRVHGFRFCLVALGGALVAGVAGMTALASYLSSGIARTLFGAALLFGFLRISHAFLQLMIEAPEGVIASYFTREPDGLAQRLLTGIRWLARIFLALLVLETFDLTTPLLMAWQGALAYQFEVGAIQFTIGSIVILVVTIAATVLLSRIVQFFLSAAVLHHLTLGRGVGDMVSKLLNYSLLTAGFLFAIGAAGFDLNRFTLLMGALGVGIGLGLQSVVGNFMSGLILLVERPFGVGDVVTVGDLTGVVTDVGIRSTRLRTWNGADIAVPNSNLTSATVTNWSLMGHQRGNEITVGVAYGSDPKVVAALLETAAREQPTVLTNPPPVAFFSGFGASSLDFTLRYWTELANFMTARSALHTTVYQRLGEAGVTIPFPQQDVRLTVEHTAEAKNEPATSADTEPAARRLS